MHGRSTREWRFENGPRHLLGSGSVLRWTDKANLSAALLHSPFSLSSMGTRLESNDPPAAVALKARARTLLDPLQAVVDQYRKRKAEIEAGFLLTRWYPYLVDFSWPAILGRAAVIWLLILATDGSTSGNRVEDAAMIAFGSSILVLPFLGILMSGPLLVIFNQVAALCAGAPFSTLRESAYRAEERIKQIESELHQELEKIYDVMAGYPPDWAIRCARIKERDGNRCTDCGWPNGGSRRGRQLQIHHVIPVSSGGHHKPDNLVTLCHICHRNVDHHHRGVRRISKTGRRY